MPRAKGNTDRVPVALSCSECGSRNYKTTKARSAQQQLKLKKFCRLCSGHTLHIESK